ncbi:MAG: NUDIX domain-containing protein [Bacteroidetes bacterium]|jgi:ADP-ribose pyrophosphatase YjhB (NUDIX family)|nr:NUDIX domain-containing protein [Bacteroidota bacterium]
MNDFIIRVYGILINDKNEVLLSHEKEFGIEFTKFPGGGLEYGEGIRECLIREFMEETGQSVKVLEHFYTTDFFIASAFHEKGQLISIYFYVDANGFKTPSNTDTQIFLWRPLNLLIPEDVTFPVDKHVVKLLNKLHRN